MLPQGGTDTRVWREVVALGAELASLAGLRGTVVEPDLALLWDWESWWAHELEWRPSVDLGYLERVRAWYEASFRAGLTVDFAHPEADLSRYRLVVAPSLYLTTERAAANLRRYVEAAAPCVVCCFSGIVDEHDRVHPGPYPGALRDVLGLHRRGMAAAARRRARHAHLAGAGIAALPAGGRRGRTQPAPSVGAGRRRAWTEAVILAGAKPVAWYADGPAAGGPPSPGTTSAPAAPGTSPPAPTPPTTAALLAAACESAGLTPPVVPIAPAPWPRDLEVVRRSRPGRRYTFLINHGPDTASVLVGDRAISVPGGDVRVITDLPASPDPLD